MAATQIALLKAEQSVREASARRNAYNAQLFGGMHKQRVAEEANNPNPMLQPAPTYADLSGLLTELSQRDRNFAEENDNCVRELLKLTNNNERLAREFMQSLTQDARLYFVEMNGPIMEDLQTAFSGRSIGATTFGAFMRKWMKEYEAEQAQTLAKPTRPLESINDSFSSDSSSSLTTPQQTPQPTPQPTPVKGPAPKPPTLPGMRADILQQMQDSPLFQKRVKQRLEEEGAMITDTGRPRKEVNNEALKKAGSEVVNEIYAMMTPDGYEVVHPPARKQKGKGIAVGFRQRIIRGKGAAVRAHICDSAYWVNLSKLRDGVLEVNYSSTNQAKLKPVSISRDTADVVRNILQDKFNRKEFTTLPEKEQRLVEHFVQTCGLGDKVDVGSKHTDELYKQYEILCGELAAGNTSPKIPPKLRQLIMELQRLKRIPVREAQQMLMQL